MKEKATYRRFDLLAFLAILGCIGMLLFECIFIFELYDRAPDQIADLVSAPGASQAAEKSVPAPAQTDIAPVRAATNAPPVTNTSPSEIQAVPVVVPVG